MARSALILAMVLGFVRPVAGEDAVPPAIDRRIDFEAEVRPLLTARCTACHGSETQKSGLRLDRRKSAMRGGHEGAAITPGDGAESLLVQLVAGLDESRVMPPKGGRLTTEEVAILRTWIDQGADWPGDDDPRSWWSLRPLERPAVPARAEFADAPPARNSIDAFVRSRLQEKGLKPSPEADRRTLARRLWFDLTGLPPTPEEVAAFAADPDPLAYEKLVDRLLASPRYGERWARHWLDVAHYGDSHGYDKDKPRPNAWPYRDYVVRALNADMPYDRFVAEQVAGDVLFPDSPEAVAALGFLAAGPWDFVGHAEVPETKSDGKVARHMDRDDMVSVTINTFLGLTVSCAQCHDHKFDPIAQKDYYSLQAVFAAVDRADRPFHDDPAVARKALVLAAGRAKADRERRRLHDLVAAQGGPALAELDRRLASAAEPGAERPEYGYHSALAARDDEARWVQVDLGRSVEVARVALWPCRDSFNGIGDGFGFPARYKIETSDDPTFARGVAILADRTGADEPRPGVAPLVFPAKAVGRYVRVTATRLAERQNDYHLALGELEVFDPSGANVAAGSKVSALDSIEAPPRWRADNLVDGIAPGRESADLEGLKAEREALLARAVEPAVRDDLAKVDETIHRLDAEKAALPAPKMVYAATIHDGGDGPFRGTGPDGGRPRPIYILVRGSVDKPSDEVGPGALNVFRELPGDLHVSPDRPEGERRAALAKWLVDDRNPLTWRVIVNRVWQYHFGRGIAATTSDFGKMGQAPTHPELLDWLAVEFRDGGRSLKTLHRLILTSAAYRQASTGDPAAEAVDSEDAFLWRSPRRKLEAEAVRDSALAVSGLLDPAMYGPAFREFVMERPEHSPHYEYDLMRPDDPSIRRRSIYRFLARSRPQPFMTVLDCADPSMQVDKRGESVSPLQALALYNNGLMLTCAKALAARVEPAGDRRAQVSKAFTLALAREPSADELSGLDALAAEHGIASACRVILNMNEFVFVD
ncbi:DUF1549 domain-containing protein [Planctomyces sp. SH-PL62]|uniref:DUF1549 domain-containing protein n=1 Tax=Planctomyces sp. SH-PL62 TaxID=1636152 RepID=UPI00078E513D|nr:DUF1549 domain-containing protein [Planctomyces sp. SH-PL62]AMV40402.1 Planctomycete cytochrome C [Planctomyces sp. SH-PL62]